MREIADAEGIPYPFLAKLVGDLVQAGFLDSFRGPRGGVRLALPPHKITVLEVVESVDGVGSMEQCFLGLAACSDLKPCPLHEYWKPMKARLVSGLASATVADLARVAVSRVS